MRPVQQRDQPDTAGADVSFPDGLSQHRRKSNRDFFFFNKYAGFCELFPEGFCRPTGITAISMPWAGPRLDQLLRAGALGAKQLGFPMSK